MNNNGPKISTEGQRDIGSFEHRQTTSDTGFFDQKPTRTSEPGDINPTSENGGFFHPCISHQECREARLKDANGGALPMNQDGQPPFRNGDNTMAPSFPGHSMGSCPMTGGFPPGPCMSGRAGGPSGPMESFLTSGDIALKGTCIISGFGFPIGLDVISQSILGIMQGSFVPGDTRLMQRPVSPVFQSNETDGTGPVSSPREMMEPGRGCDNPMLPATGDSNCPPGDRFDRSTSYNGGFPGPDQKQISTAECEYPSMGGSPP